MARIVNLQAEDGTGPIFTVRVLDETTTALRAEVIEAKCEPLTFLRAAWREVTLSGNAVEERHPKGAEPFKSRAWANAAKRHRANKSK